MKLPKDKLEIRYPKEFIRLSDGAIFYRADDGKYYNKISVLDFPNHIHLGFRYVTLAKTYSKYFKPIY